MNNLIINKPFASTCFPRARCARISQDVPGSEWSRDDSSWLVRFDDGDNEDDNDDDSNSRARRLRTTSPDSTAPRTPSLTRGCITNPVGGSALLQARGFIYAERRWIGRRFSPLSTPDRHHEEAIQERTAPVRDSLVPCVHRVHTCINELGNIVLEWDGDERSRDHRGNTEDSVDRMSSIPCGCCGWQMMNEASRENEKNPSQQVDRSDNTSMKRREMLLSHRSCQSTFRYQCSRISN